MTIPSGLLSVSIWVALYVVTIIVSIVEQTWIILPHMTIAVSGEGCFYCHMATTDIFFRAFYLQVSLEKYQWSIYDPIEKWQATHVECKLSDNFAQSYR